MIVNLIKKLASIIFGFFSDIVFPVLPDEVLIVSRYLVQAFQLGSGILDFFLPFEKIRIGVEFLLLVLSAKMLYYGLLFLLKKIPFLGVK